MLISNRYQIGDKLGQGGVGVVHKALDRLTGEFVALKQLKVPVSNLRFASQHFQGSTGDKHLALAFEFRTLASLHHPNIVSVLDYGVDEQWQPFFTMQLIEDAQMITRCGPDLNLPARVRLLVEMLQALAYLHRRNIIHRDLKPSNVLVSAAGSVKVLDFGLAISHSPAMAVGLEGLAGTLAYMAPELFDGKEATVQSDLFAVGVIAYELLVGIHPFNDASTTLTLLNIISEPVDTSMLPDRLAAVVDRLLAKKPDERYSDAAEVIEALSRALGQPLGIESIPVRESYLQASEFVGREAELETLKTALAHILKDPPKGSAWLIGGESGVGKSRLVDELRIRAVIRGALVLRGQAVAGAGLLYQLWREPLRRLILSMALSDTDAAILKELVADIEDLLGRQLPAVVALEGKDRQQRLFSTITSLFQRQGQPIVLILEDLQWAGTNLELLNQLASMVGGLPLLLIANYRDDEAPDLPQMLPTMRHMKLERLTARAIEELAVSMLGEVGKRPELTTLLKRETEGNAFFMVEVVRVLAEEAGRLADIGRKKLPASVFAGGVKNVIQRRLDRVPGWGQPMLRLAAVAGREVDLRILGPQSDDLQDWLTACANAAVLEFREGRWRFSHDKLREALLMSLPADERAQLHRKVAETIEQVYAGDDTRTVMLLEHWRMAGDAEREIAYALRAVEQLYAVTRYREVTEIIRRTLPRISDARVRTRLLCRLGEAEFGLGDTEQATEHFLEVMAAAQEANDQDLQMLCLKNMGNVAMRLGNLAAAWDYYRKSLALARELDDWQSIAWNLEYMGDTAALQSDFVTARGYYEQSLEISRQIDDKRGIAGSLSGLGWVASGQSEYAVSRQCFEQSLEISRQIGDRKMIARSLGNLGAITSAQGDYATALEYYQQQLQIHYETGLKAGVAWSLWAISRLLCFQGSYEAASDYNQQSLAINRELGDKTYIAANLRVRGQIAFMRGDDVGAQTAYQEAFDIAQEIGQQLGITEGLVFLGQVAAARGDYAAAQDYFERGLALTRELRFMDGIANALNGLASVALGLGDYAAARAHSEEALQVAREISYTDGLIASLTQLGLLAALQGDPPGAVEYYTTGLKLAERAGFEARSAAAWVHLGFVYLEQAQTGAAVEAFMDGLSMAYHIGAIPVVLEALIGFAWVYLKTGKLPQSADLADFLSTYPLHATTSRLRLGPLRAYLKQAGAQSKVLRLNQTLDDLVQNILERSSGFGL